MAKYKIVKEPDFKVSIGSFEAEAFFEGTATDESVIISSSGVEIPLDCCKAISDNESKEEEERWVLSEYG